MTSLSAPEPQVFRDDSGKRWRRVQGALAVLTVACSAFGALLLLGLVPGKFGNGSLGQTTAASASFDARLAHRPHKRSPERKADEAIRTQALRFAHIDPWHRTAERDAKESSVWASHFAFVMPYDQLSKETPAWTTGLNTPTWLNVVIAAEEAEDIDWGRVRDAANRTGAAGIVLDLCDARLLREARKATKRPIAVKCSASLAKGVISSADFVIASLEQFDPPWLQTREDLVRELATLDPKKLVIDIPTQSTAWPVDTSTIERTGNREVLTFAAIGDRGAANISRWDDDGQRAILMLPSVCAPHCSSTELTTESMAWIADSVSALNEVATADRLGAFGVSLGTLGEHDPRLLTALTRELKGEDPTRELETIKPDEGWSVVGNGIALEVRTETRDGRARVERANGALRETIEALPQRTSMHRRAPVTDRMIVLTFDDGPDPVFTPLILDMLKSEQVKATFFIVGTQAEREPALVKRIANEGHELGNHSFSHADLATVLKPAADFEVAATDRAIETLTGKKPWLFRAPYRSNEAAEGPLDLVALARAQGHGHITIASTLDAHDWARPTATQMVTTLVTAAEQQNGGVVLLHDAGGDRTETVKALRPLIVQLRAARFRFAQVHDVMGLSIDQVNPSVDSSAVQHATWWSASIVIRGLGVFAIASLLLGMVRYLALLLGGLVQAYRERSIKLTTSSTAERLQVSVIVPAYNEASVILRTVRSLLGSEGVDVEVLVMDDGSTDGTADVVEREFQNEPRVKLFRLRNGGKSAALNRGFMHASHDLIVALDADTLFYPDTIARLVAPFSNPRVGAVAGRARVGNVKNWLGRWQALEYVVGQAFEKRAWSLLGVVNVVPGAVGAWRRQAVLRAGGFSRHTLAEDTDLTIAIQAAGWRIEYASDAVALTEAPEEISALLKQRFRWCFGVLQAAWKHRRAWMQVRKNPRQALILMPSVLLFHIVTPLLAPLGDIAAIIAIAGGHGKTVLPYALSVTAIEFLFSALGVLLDRARGTLLIDWIAYRIFYRWILFLALGKAIMTAIRGSAVGWGKLERSGNVMFSGRPASR